MAQKTANNFAVSVLCTVYNPYDDEFYSIGNVPKTQSIIARQKVFLCQIKQHITKTDGEMEVQQHEPLTLPLEAAVDQIQVPATLTPEIQPLIN
jgi:hypothetical protein